MRLAPEEARAVRAVIEAQLDAFRHDDAARAFSYATDDIHDGTWRINGCRLIQLPGKVA